MKLHWNILVASSALASLALIVSPSRAIDVRVTIENLSGPTSIAFSPLIASAHDGSVDNFDSLSLASPGVENVAELGSVGALLVDEIMLAQATAVATPLMNADSSFGPLLPGAQQSVVLSLDPTANRYFSYLAMAVPSNDLFLGNDDPQAIELFDAGGAFVAQDFMLTGQQLWDAGTELNGLLGAAFIVGQDATAGAAENGVIHPADLATSFSHYAGAMTPVGYTFSGGPAADTPIVAISFQDVPEPASVALAVLAGLGLLGLGVRRPRQR